MYMHRSTLENVCMYIYIFMLTLDLRFFFTLWVWDGGPNWGHTTSLSLDHSDHNNVGKRNHFSFLPASKGVEGNRKGSKTKDWKTFDGIGRDQEESTGIERGWGKFDGDQDGDRKGSDNIEGGGKRPKGIEQDRNVSKKRGRGTNGNLNYERNHNGEGMGSKRMERGCTGSV